MNASDDSTAIKGKGLRGWWLTPPRPGMQRWIAPWEYRHLRAWAAIRVVGGTAGACLGAYVLSHAWPSPWAIFGIYLLVTGAANLPFANWELNIANNPPRQP